MRIHRCLRRPSLLLAGLALALVGAAPGAALAARSPAAPHHRGELLSVRHLAHVEVPELRRRLGAIGIATGRVRHPVDAYRLVYDTVGVDGGATRASGLVVVPEGVGDEPPIALYEHGTQSARDEAPSFPGVNDGYVSGLLLGSSGLAVAAPDYLGLGPGPGPHPYLDLPSETTASVDVAKAARAFLARRGLRPRRDLMVTGFSHGGAAAIAVAHRLQSAEPDGLSLAALAAISGPYDLRGVELPAAAAGRLVPSETPFYIAYLLTAWNRIHHLAPSLDEIFRAPYDRRVEALFGGGADFPEVIAGLPSKLPDLLTPRWLGELRHPRGRFARAVRAGDPCRGWRPQVPVHLFAADGDHVVPIANAASCARELRARGARVTLTDVGAVEHEGGALRALPKVAASFAHVG